MTVDGRHALPKHLKQIKAETKTDQKNVCYNAILMALHNTDTYYFEKSSSKWASSHLFC
jgi:hypothetical protein